MLAALAGAAIAQPAPAAPPDPLAAFDAEMATVLAQPGGLTAAQAAARAGKHSPAAARKRAEVEAARATIGQIKIALIPITKVTASYTRLSDVPALQFGAMPIQPQLNAIHFGAEVAVPVTDLVMRLPPAKQAALDQVTATELGGDAAALDAGAQAEQLYYEWVRASLATLVAEKQVAQVEANRAQLAALVEVQRASRADLLQLEAGKAQAELAVAQVKQASQVLADQLRVLMGAGPDETLTIGDDIRVIDELPALGRDRDLVDAALRRRYEARALDAAVAALDHHAAETKVQRLPKLNLFGQVVYDQPNQRYFLDYDFHASWAVGVQVTWSPNDFLYTDPNLQSIASQRRAVAADRAGLAMSIESQIASARSALAVADAAYQASQRGLAAAAEGYRVRQDLLANERATATEVLVAETALTTARLAAINALIDRHIAWAKLRHAAGLDVPGAVP